MADVILTAAFRLSQAQMNPLLRSAARYCGAEVHCWTDAALEDCVLHAWPANQVRPHNDRWAMWLEWLERNETGRVMVCDGRDVLLQDNPFAELPDGLNVFCEAETMTIRACPYNSVWAARMYGDAWLNQIGDNPITCCGVTIGDHDSMVRYLRAIVGEQWKRPGETWLGADTAIHQRVVYDELVPATIWPNEAGPVYTVGYLPRESVATRDGLILNRAGEAPAVVHQYDRHRNLSAMVAERWAR